MRPTVKRWCIIVLATVVVACVGTTAFKHWASDSSKGTVNVGTPKTQTPEAPKEPLVIETAYFTTQLPPNFSMDRESQTPDKTILLQLTASSNQQRFSVTYGELPAEGLEAVGDYNLRASTPSDYEPYRPAGMPIAATAFRTTTGPAGLTVFWPHGSQYAEITATGDTGTKLSDLFNTFVRASHNWQWL